jgi:hypothetical protein
MNGVGLDQDYVWKITGPYTWEGSSFRVETVYRQALEERYVQKWMAMATMSS